MSNFAVFYKILLRFIADQFVFKNFAVVLNDRLGSKLLEFLLTISRLNSERVSFCPILFKGLNFVKFEVVSLIEIPSERLSS